MGFSSITTKKVPLELIHHLCNTFLAWGATFMSDRLVEALREGASLRHIEGTIQTLHSKYV